MGVLAAAGALILAAIGIMYYQAKRRPGGNGQYVAMGSSFAAGPGVGRRAPGSPRLAGRSEQNYAHLLAKARGLSLTDVTCSGATTLNVLEGGQYFLPPQVDALRPDSELVTVTVGGNDLAYIGNVMAWSWEGARDRLPLAWRLMAFEPIPDAEVDRALEVLPERLARVAAEVRRRSPARDARLRRLHDRAARRRLLPGPSTAERGAVAAGPVCGREAGRDHGGRRARLRRAARAGF